MVTRTSNRMLRAAGYILSAMMGVSVAWAQYSTGFESPPFTSGALNGQDGWTSGGAVSVRTASQIEAELTASGLTPEEAVHSGDQALLVSGAGSGVTSRHVIAGLDTLNQVLLDVWVRPLSPRADVGATGLGNTFLLIEDSSNVAAGRAAGFRFGYYDNGSGAAAPHLDYAGSASSIWQDSGLSWSADAWYNIQMLVDFSTQTYDVLVDGTQINTSPIGFYQGNTVASVGAVRVYRGSNQAGMIMDDVAVIPEPSAIALLLLGGCAMVLARKR